MDHPLAAQSTLSDTHDGIIKCKETRINRPNPSCYKQEKGEAIISSKMVLVILWLDVLESWRQGRLVWTVFGSTGMVVAVGLYISAITFTAVVRAIHKFVPRFRILCK